MYKFFLFLVFFYSYSFSYTQTIDSKNVYWSSIHFRAIAGASYANDSFVVNFASKLLDAAELSWQKEVVEFGFKEPKNSDTKLIDIYIGNKSAYNYDFSIYEYISNNYAGWATSYSDGTPYFTMNPILEDNQIKVTIAHEFFHTIQYAYYDGGYLDGDDPDSDIWWLEATSTMIEDEVYDTINDYKNYLSQYENSHTIFSDSTMNIETYDGWHEYSTVVFAKYIKEKFGIEVVKKTFEQIESVGSGYFRLLDKILKEEYNSSIKDALKEFAIWIGNPSIYFEEGSLYPTVTKFDTSANKIIKKGGILFLKNIENYPIVSNDIYSQTNLNGNENIYSTLDDIVVISNPSSSNIYTSTILANFNLEFKYSFNSSGWFLVGGEDINISTIKGLNCIDLVWSYDNNKWKVSNNISPTDLNGFDEIEQIDNSKGYWIKTNSSCIID